MSLWIDRRLVTVVATLTISAGAVSASACGRASPVPPGTPATVSTLPPAADGARLPEALADSTWWQLVTGMSEPGGYFRSENFVSNEMGVQRVVPTLQRYVPRGGVYVGVGPEQNFTYITTLEPRVAFIVDIRRQNLLQHLWYKAVFELSPTRAAFLTRLFARPLPATARDANADSLMAWLERAAPDSALFGRTWREVERHLLTTRGIPLDSSDRRTLRYVDSVFFLSGPALNYSSSLANGGMRFASRRMPSFADVARATDTSGHNVGFLASEAAYARVRERQQRNLIIPVVGNFAGPTALRAVGNWLRAHDARVHAFYTSNVEQYLFQQPGDWERFYGNVGGLPLAPSARFIRSVTGGWGMRSGFLMTQLTSDIGGIVLGAANGDIRGYADVIRRSTPE